SCSVVVISRELFDRGPRVPRRQRDELDLFAIRFSQKKCAAITLHAMDSGKHFGLQQLFVCIGIFRRCIAMPHAHDHGRGTSLTTLPDLRTKTTCSNAATSLRGSPSTAMMSAYFPFAI